MTNKEKFLALVSKEETNTVERAKVRLAKKNYSKISNLIAFEILERLEELNWKQIHLAEKMGVSPQQVNKWVKGTENFTLETLIKLGNILEISLIEIPKRKSKFQTDLYTLSSNTRYEKIKGPAIVKVFTSIHSSMKYENRFAIAK